MKISNVTVKNSRSEEDAMNKKDVFRILPNIYNGTLCEMTIDSFHKKIRYIFDTALNTPLIYIQL